MGPRTAIDSSVTFERTVDLDVTELNLQPNTIYLEFLIGHDVAGPLHRPGHGY